MSDRPEVSVIVPAYDSGRFLAESIRSIEAQGHGRLEIVVVDDGSTDDTARVAKSLGDRVVYHRQDNRGPSAARNAGLERARGAIIGFLDADDLWPQHSLRVRLDYLERHADVAIVQGLVQDMWPDLHAPGRHQLDPPRPGFNVGCALFRRRVFDTVGLFDASLHHGEDVDLMVRTEARGLARHRLADVTLTYRRRLADDVGGYRRHIGNLARAIKRTLDRERRD